MPLTVGSRIAHYDVTALIGEGGMGEVYRARETLSTASQLASARMTRLGRCTVAVFREAAPESLNRTESFPIQVDADAIVTAQRFSWDWECLRCGNVGTRTAGSARSNSSQSGTWRWSGPTIGSPIQAPTMR